jgi:glutamine amidotransferase
MISVLDYGLGNLGSVINMLNHVRIPNKLINTNDEILQADSILLPGVGSYDAGMKNLHEKGFIQPLNEHATIRKKPILGICLGAQLLMNESEEGQEKGLGWIDGNVQHFKNLLGHQSQQLRIPHMGWSQIETSDPLFDKMDEDRRFYFVHSYYLKPSSYEHILCKTHYGEPYAAGIQKDNITGVQFHPEKSHQYGMQFFKNYYEKIRNK